MSEGYRYQKNGVGLPEVGKCYKCGLNKVPVEKFRGQYYCLYDIQKAKDSTPQKIRNIERDVDEFNAILKKSLGADNASTEITYL